MQRATSLDTEEAAAEAVKAYLRLHRERLANDPEMLALLLPGRFAEAGSVRDYQHFVIGRLASEVAALKSERAARARRPDRNAPTREGVKRLVLDLLDAHAFEDVIGVACGAAPHLGADIVSFGIESEAGVKVGNTGMCLLAPGTVATFIEPAAVGAVVTGDAPSLLFPAGLVPRCAAVFRLRFGRRSPSALYAVGSHDLARFDDEGETREIAHFVRALERAMRSWLEPPQS
jgi:uncharacterized protein YigA (DUF484 family)